MSGKISFAEGCLRSGMKGLPDGFQDRRDLSVHATPRLLRKTPIHNWFVFPHSYSNVLVESLFDHWRLNNQSRVYDPFVGAGTTLLAAKARSTSAIGTDISPLSAFVANAKVASYERNDLLRTWGRIQSAIGRLPLPQRVTCSGFLERAFESETRLHLERIRRAIDREARSMSTQFFLLALLRILPHYSRALPDGGWFRWRRVRASPETISERFRWTVERMLADLLPLSEHCGEGPWHAYMHDARSPLRNKGQFDALITSPPYPNRHDYTRIFTSELLFQFLDENELKTLRHRNLCSHVEARSIHSAKGWQPPRTVENVVDKLGKVRDKRVPRMIWGYFEDMHHVFVASKQVVRRGGHMAFVVGNVRHAGVHVPVDEILAEIGKGAGLRWKETWLIRMRGNSAQQMGRFGRQPSRESVVIFERR